MTQIKFNIPFLKLYENFNLSNINFDIKANTISTWIGNNGSGKTSLIKLLIKNQKIKDKMIFIDDQDLNKITYKNLSRYISYVPQVNLIYPELSVYDFVSIGRLPYTNFLGFLSRRDKVIIDDILCTLKLFDLKDKKIGSLSGGQRQKVIIANALVQQTSIIVLDEPLNHLDVQAREEICDLILNLKNDWNKTIIIVLHDFEVAANIADSIVYFSNGQTPIYGLPKEVLTSENIKKYFNVDRKIIYEKNKIRILD